MSETRDDARQLLIDDILRRRDHLLVKGDLPTPERLSGYYARFAEEFGPQALSGLDGPALLEKMHLHGNKESLVYWLEFKNDDELPAVFGGIGGGSAFKFGLYRRKETGVWVTGNARDVREVSVTEAVGIARKHREQLLAGLAALTAFPVRGSDEDYARLQMQLERDAPDTQDSAWARKYFTMLSPEKLDDFHNPDYERFFLMQTLQTPPAGKGRYRCSGRFVSLAQELAIPMNHLTAALGARAPKPYNYWLVKVGREAWPEMRDRGFVGLDRTVPEDLSGLDHDQTAKDRVQGLTAECIADSSRAKRYGQELFHFAALMHERDVLLATVGSVVVGVGKVAGEYQFDASSDLPHQHPVEWMHTGEWSHPPKEASGAEVLARLRTDAFLVDIERKMLEGRAACPPNGDRTGAKMTSLVGVPGQVQKALERKGQVILYGPPGTGKTFWAIASARELAAQQNLGRSFRTLEPAEAGRVFGAPEAFVRMCTFHPAYGYEDFIEGYRPESSGDNLIFTLRPGIFKRLCEEARERPANTYFLIIDEINRGDIPRIFGELLTLLELSKRDLGVTLPLSGEPFQVPPNVRVIGTMNTADRSIALLDTALRRRFGFVELMPDSNVLGATVVEGVPLGPWLDSLNARVREHLGADARNLQVGHSYLMDGERPIADFVRLRRVLHEDVLPLLQEYCYDDWERLESILGTALVDAAARSFRHELFQLGGEEKLVQALLSPDPELATSLGVAAAEDALPDEGTTDEGPDADEDDAPVEA